LALNLGFVHSDTPLAENRVSNRDRACTSLIRRPDANVIRKTVLASMRPMTLLPGVHMDYPAVNPTQMLNCSPEWNALILSSPIPCLALLGER
jgi:hypothetical protein